MRKEVFGTCELYLGDCMEFMAALPEYFQELFRVSKYRIIWGGNYFSLPPSRNFIIWRKPTLSENFSMAMAEFAWTNIAGNAKVFEFAPQDAARFHPTQKPVALYKRLLWKYAEPGWRILDTHGGSFSSAAAAYEAGFDYAGIEIDKDYFEAAVKRMQDLSAQPFLIPPAQKEAERLFS
jgi:site-specific DNA-methyltransferase (adenine-specific)